MKKEPIKKAVAIKYDPGETAPKVIASGKGLVAEKILEHGSDIPVYKDSKLVEELEKIEIGSQIPPELYEVVAQVLIFISDLDKLESYNRHAK